MKFLPFLFSVALLIGCAPRMATVRFESEPAGARVFASYGHDEKAARSRSYVGQTPCTGQFEIEGNGAFKVPSRIPVFSEFVQPVLVFTAEHDGQSRQEVFHGASTFQAGSKAPPAVFFDFKKAAQ